MTLSTQLTQIAPDRRRFPRMELDHPVDLVEIDRGARHEGRAVSLSGGGLLFDCETALEIGTELEITLTPPLTVTGSLRAVLEVVRCDAVGDGSFRLGGRFVRMLTD